MPSFVIRAAAAGDTARIRDLLKRGGLPTSDLAISQPQFIVACEGSQIIGTGALQHLRPIALLRSVAVEPRSRGSGAGRLIVRELERLARASDIAQLVLLTQTAKRFFECQGYRVIAREHLPPAAQESEEFRSLCPVSATCMSKSLAGLS